MARVTVTVSKDGGNVIADAEGFYGEACKRVTDPLFARLGTVVSVEDKPELYMTEQAAVKEVG